MTRWIYDGKKWLGPREPDDETIFWLNMIMRDDLWRLTPHGYEVPSSLIGHVVDTEMVP